MSTPNDASTSSSPSEGSARWHELKSLGATILDSLTPSAGPRDEPDFLSAWISHELAAAITRVDETSGTERDAAVDHAIGLILRLWQHRSNWPHGWPPPRVAALLDLLTAEVADPEDAIDSGGSSDRPWSEGLSRLHELQLQEMGIWFRLSLLELGDSRKFAALFPSDDEAGDIHRLLALDGTLEDGFKWLEGLDNGEADGVAEAVRSELDALQRRRELLADETLSASKVRSTSGDVEPAEDREN